MAWINFFHSLIDFVFPQHCLVCGEPLTFNEETVCMRCLNELPFTELPFSTKNIVTERLLPHVKIHKATALMFYHKNGSSGKLIHALKYEGKQYAAKMLGRYLAPFLSEDPPEVIIPVPLHKKKLKIRGYNQLEQFGLILANELNAKYRDDILIKTKHTESQTTRSPLERWQNVKATFSVKKQENFKGKHVLLIDDVLTTGSTLSAAAHVILESLPEIRLSVAVMAIKWD